MKNYTNEQVEMKSEKWEKNTNLLSMILVGISIISFFLKAVSPYFMLIAVALILGSAFYMTRLVVEKAKQVNTVPVQAVKLENTLS